MKETFGEILRKLRENANMGKGLSTTEAAYKSGVSANYWVQIETGHRIPSLGLALRMTKILEITGDTKRKFLESAGHGDFVAFNFEDEKIARAISAIGDIFMRGKKRLTLEKLNGLILATGFAAMRCYYDFSGDSNLMVVDEFKKEFELSEEEFNQFIKICRNLSMPITSIEDH